MAAEGGARTFDLSVVTPEGAAFEGEAEMVIVPGAAGEIGVLARHAPLVAMLKAGEIRVKAGDEWQSFAAGPGYFKVQQDRAIALVDDAVRAEDIDIEEARREADEARAALERAEAGDEEIDRWQHRAAAPSRREQDFRRRPMKAFAPGIYPRSEALVQATRDLERGPHHAGSRRRARASATSQELVSVQRAAGLSLPQRRDARAGRISSARSRSAAEGLDARPLTRFLDTNTFYRAVLVDGEPHLRDPAARPRPSRRRVGWNASVAARVRTRRSQRGLGAEARRERPRAADRGMGRGRAPP